MDNKRNTLVAISMLSLLSGSADANGVWIDSPEINLQLKGEQVLPLNYRYLRAERYQLENALQSVPLENTGAAEVHFELPLPDGTMREVSIEESPILSDDIAVRFPDYKTYRVKSTSAPWITGRLDLVATGFHGYLNTDNGVVVIDPDPTNPDYYRSYYKYDLAGIESRHFNCLHAEHNQPVNHVSRPASLLSRNDDELRTYNLAVATTYEYSNVIAGNNVTNTFTEITTAINRVNTIYERDVSISLTLVTDETFVSTVPGELTDGDPTLLISEAKSFIETTKGLAEAAYDVGHVFSTGAGGLAGLGVVCDDTNKASGVTGLSTPTGDLFYIDFVAHELGHQFGANHTFNGTTSSCGGNRNDATAYEPGSGSSIMAYAGICGDENVQTAALSPTVTGGGVSEDTFHAGSIAEIYDFSRTGGGNACGVVSNNANTKPTVSAGANFTIPGQTPFELRGTINDAEGDTVAFHWDQMDIGSATDSTTYGSDLGDNPLFRTFAPTSFVAPVAAPGTPNAIRVLPRIETIVSGVDDKAERLPSLSRTMNFRLMARDGNYGIEESDMQVTVDQNAGPFQVLSAATATTLDSLQPQVIEWNAACTDDAALTNCANVDILLSTDSGATFPTVLVAATPNDGEESVSLPATTSTTALIKIACSDNIFFDVNDSLITLEAGTGDALTSTGVGGSYNCGTASTAGGNTSTAPSFDVSSATTVDLTTDITGSVNSLTTTTNVFQFTGTDEVYTFVLSEYGTSDLDLHITDSSGNVLVQSTSTENTETIRLTLVAGSTYHLVISAKDTGGISQPYNVSTTISQKSTLVTTDDSGALGPLSLVLLMLYGLVRRSRKKI